MAPKWTGKGNGMVRHMIQIRSRRCADNGMTWTSPNGRNVNEDQFESSGDELRCSLCGSWVPQQERDGSLTLPIEETELLDAQIPLMARIIHPGGP